MGMGFFWRVWEGIALPIGYERGLFGRGLGRACPPYEHGFYLGWSDKGLPSPWAWFFLEGLGRAYPPHRVQTRFIWNGSGKGLPSEEVPAAPQLAQPPSPPRLYEQAHTNHSRRTIGVRVLRL